MRENTFDWVVIGAGPAGIAALGKLLDAGIAESKIGWIDPEFRVGDLGTKWQNVPSNTKVELFLKFLHACRSFHFDNCREKFPIQQLDPNGQCLLKEIAEPLQWVTSQLSSRVHTIKGECLALKRDEGFWEIKMKTPMTLRAKNVILATGSEPKMLPMPHPESIPLETALDPHKLARAVRMNDIVGVFGSSHSAILVLATLMQSRAKMVYNFYRSPHLYAVDMQNWILFDNTGLKGYAAKWARENLDGILPTNLKRISIYDQTFEEELKQCTKVIHAVGFERRKAPVIEGFPGNSYHETTGIIAPGLFGLGIAYPQVQLDPFGNREYRVGLWKFMDYLNTMIPIWLKYANASVLAHKH